jgi:putative PIN family toxin of toxin-antitoxin system
MRVVLDTNVLLVSISRHSKYHPIFEAFENEQFDILVTTDILTEYEEVISNNMGFETAKNVLDGFKHVQNVIHISKYFYWNLIVADPDDDKFVDCAIAGNADFIVSNDKHFNALKKLTFQKSKSSLLMSFSPF